MKQKRMVSQLLLITMLMLSMAQPVCAQEEYDGYTWGDKLKRGVVNAFTSPIEVVRGIDLSSKSDGPLYGWTAGIMLGFAGGILRFGTGAVDAFTCPFNFPEEDKEPMIEPEFVWEDWEGEYLE